MDDQIIKIHITSQDEHSLDILKGKLFRFFIKTKKGKIQFARAFFLLYIPTILLFLSSIIEGTTFTLPESQGLGLFKLYSFFFSMILSPIIVISASSLLLKFSKFLASSYEIIDNEAFILSNTDNKLKQKLTVEEVLRFGYRKSKYYIYFKTIFLIVGISASILTSYNHTIPVEHYSHDFFLSINYPLAYISGRLFYFLFWGFLYPILLYKFIIIIHSLNSYFRILKRNNCLVLEPLHPDNAGGLGILGNLALKIDYIAMIFVFEIVAYYIDHGITYTIILGIIAFVLLLFIVFFAPLHEAHKAMAWRKKELLERLSKIHIKIDKIITKRIFLTDEPVNLFDSKGNELYSLNEKIADLYKNTKNLPVWPYDVRTISKFFVTLVLPFLIYVIEILKTVL